MHSEELPDHELMLKSLLDLEAWCKEDGIEELAKSAAYYHKFGLDHMGQI